jgi:thiamine-monophosphate kinase
LSTPGKGPAGPLVSEIGERGLIERIRGKLPGPPADLLVGPGDDAAVVRPERGAFEILTTDAVVEGVHFDRRFSTPGDVGHKALAINLSDIASMGGTPRFALLSLLLPESCSLEAFDGLLDGFLKLASQARVTVAGGNISRSPGPLVVDVTVTGSVRPRKILTRSGGRPGDRLYVSGTIGASSAGLSWLEQHAGAGGIGAPEGAVLDCVERHRRPQPRVRLGAVIGRTRAASACMDLSDGLADAVRQVAEASGTGARIDADRLPIHQGALEIFGGAGKDPVESALAGGDDYELLFAVPARFKGRFRAAARLGHAAGWNSSSTPTTRRGGPPAPTQWGSSSGSRRFSGCTRSSASCWPSS